MDNADNGVAGVDVAHIITILSVSRFEEDHIALEQIFGDPGTTLYPNCRARIIRCFHPSDISSALDGTRIPVVVCDTGYWEQTTKELQAVSKTTCIILSDSFAGDRLYAEAAAHGVYDVLAKPFRASDVLRIIRMAWLHWQNRYGLPSAAPAGGEGPSEESGPQKDLTTANHCNSDQPQITEE